MEGPADMFAVSILDDVTRVIETQSGMQSRAPGPHDRV